VITTGVGGDVICDLILGIPPPLVFFNRSLATGLSAGRGFGDHRLGTVGKPCNLLVLADAIGLGVFCADGAAKTLSQGLSSPIEETTNRVRCSA